MREAATIAIIIIVTILILVKVLQINNIGKELYSLAQLHKWLVEKYPDLLTNWHAVDDNPNADRRSKAIKLLEIGEKARQRWFEEVSKRKVRNESKTK